MTASPLNPAQLTTSVFPRAGAQPASTARLPARVDALVIGSGAGGSAAAFRLAGAGKSVLLLEKGVVLPDDGSPMDPVKVAGDDFGAREQWRDVQGKEDIRPQEHFNLGGKTCWYGAALLRMSAEEFKAEPSLDLLPWPVAFEEFERYYDEMESLLEVRVYPDEPDLAKMLPTFQGQGWQASPLNLGVTPDIREAPFIETHYDGYGVPGHYKANGVNRLLEKVKDLPNLTILTGADVIALLPDADNPRRLAGVKLRDGREVHADTVWLAAGTMHSPRLLGPYLSTTGLDKELPGANLVGRYFKKHILTAVIGFGLKQKQDRLCKTRLLSHAKYPHGGIQPLGGVIDAETVRAILGPYAPAAVVNLFATRAYGFFLQTEDGSHPDNRVEGSLATDEMPRLDYTTERMPKLAAEHRDMVVAFMAALARAGYMPFKQSTPLAGTAHCVGTLVAGTDPAASVVDADGRVHGLENLYVVDGSALPRLGSPNPGLTIFCWGLRAVDRFLGRTGTAATAAPVAAAEAAPAPATPVAA